MLSKHLVASCYSSQVSVTWMRSRADSSVRYFLKRAMLNEAIASPRNAEHPWLHGIRHCFYTRMNLTMPDRTHIHCWRNNLAG